MERKRLDDICITGNTAKCWINEEKKMNDTGERITDTYIIIDRVK